MFGQVFRFLRRSAPCFELHRPIRFKEVSVRLCERCGIQRLLTRMSSGAQVTPSSVETCWDACRRPPWGMREQDFGKSQEDFRQAAGIDRSVCTRLMARRACCIGMVFLVAACGTTYQVPETNAVHEQAAQRMFAEEQNPFTAKSGEKLSIWDAETQFRNVVMRVEPVAERFCRQETADRTNFDCNISIRINNRLPVRNALQYYENGRPVVEFTRLMIGDARNSDELAFIIGHEMGHHIGQHQHKKQQQQVAGAIILGALTAYGQAYANSVSPYRYRGNDQRDLENSMAIGAGVGVMAYSQTYELESDVIGTAIAKAAGYDPVRGARVFARPEPQKTTNGRLSFWGTHPPDVKRIATVLAVNEAIEVSGKISRKENVR